MTRSEATKIPKFFTSDIASLICPATKYVYSTLATTKVVCMHISDRGRTFQMLWEQTYHCPTTYIILSNWVHLSYWVRGHAEILLTSYYEVCSDKKEFRMSRLDGSHMDRSMRFYVRMYVFMYVSY